MWWSSVDTCALYKHKAIPVEVCWCLFDRRRTCRSKEKDSHLARTKGVQRCFKIICSGERCLLVEGTDINVSGCKLVKGSARMELQDVVNKQYVYYNCMFYGKNLNIRRFTRSLYGITTLSVLSKTRFKQGVCGQDAFVEGSTRECIATRHTRTKHARTQARKNV